MISFLKPAPAIPELSADRIDPSYRRLRWQVFAGIFVGYAAFYLVRNNFALAMPAILKAHPEYSKVQLGWAMTGLLTAYGVAKFIMGAVSDRSNPRTFMALGLLLTSGVTFAFGTVPGIYGSLALIVGLQTLNGWCNGMGWPPCGKTMVHWWSTTERGRIVATWNVAHNVGGALIAVFAAWGVAHFGQWQAPAAPAPVKPIDAAVPAARPRVVLLCFGGNDALNKIPRVSTLANLGAIIDRLHNAGSFVVLIGIALSRVSRTATTQKVCTVYVVDVSDATISGIQLLPGEQAAGTMAIVTEAAMKRKGAVDQAALDDLQQRIIERFDSQMSVFVTSARLLDDGVIDPRDTRSVLALVLAVCRQADARQPQPMQFSVARP